MTTMIKASAMRFLKGFVAGGLASVATFLAAGVTIHDLSQLQTFAYPLAMAFVTGGILGIEKLLTWKNEVPPMQP